MNQISRTIFNPGTYSKNTDILLLVLRLSAGILMLTHGLGKLEALFGAEPIQFADPLGVGEPTSLALTVFAEVFCSFLLIVGLGTRLVVVPLLFTMLIAIFIIHANDGFAKQELPLLYVVIYITILVLGAGRYSLDYLIMKRRSYNAVK